jgi:hypothetical protein
MSLLDKLYADDGAADTGGGGGGEASADGRPEGIAEKFWNTETGSVNVQELSDSYNQLSASYSKKTEDIRADIDTQRFANRPENPEGYEFRMPEVFETPPGYEFHMEPDHPLVGFWRQHAYDHGLDQKAFDDGVAMYMNAEAGTLPVITEEQESLGERGQDRFSRATDFMRSVVSDEEFAKLGGLVTTAEGIQVVEKIMHKVGTPFDRDSAGPIVTAPEDDPSNQDMYDSKTKQLMAEDGPGTYRDGDPAAIQIVRDRWSRSHPNNTSPERNRRR